MASPLERLARQRARKYGLSPKLFVRQIRAESGFNPTARSPAGALGVAQIMPATAKGWGVDPLNPKQALDAAAKNMARYVKQFGSYENALRAYNAGPGAVEKSKGYAETNNYVKKIMAGATGRERRAPAARGTDPSWETKSAFDRDAFEKERKRAVVGQMLARRNPMSLLARLLPQEMPDRADFTSSSEKFTPGRAGDSAAPARAGKPGKGKGGLRELFHDPGVNIDEGAPTKAIGGHGKHVHAAFDDPRDRAWAERLAHSMGLTVTSEGGGKHTPGSFHYQRLKGGESAALDVGGDPAKLLAYNRAIARRFGARGR